MWTRVLAPPKAAPADTTAAQANDSAGTARGPLGAGRFEARVDPVCRCGADSGANCAGGGRAEAAA